MLKYIAHTLIVAKKDGRRLSLDYLQRRIQGSPVHIATILGYAKDIEILLMLKMLLQSGQKKDLWGQF